MSDDFTIVYEALGKNRAAKEALGRLMERIQEAERKLTVWGALIGDTEERP